MVRIKAKIANDFYSRLKGLLGTDEFPNDGALFFPNVSSIHTFFMKYSIDVIFLDVNRKVIRLKENVKPYRIVFGGLKADSVLEMPCGSIKKMNINLGDLLSIEGY